MRKIVAEKLPSGNYRARVSYMVDGKKVTRSFTADTANKAERMAEEQRYMRKRESAENITLKKAFEGYIEIKSNVLSPCTIRAYRNIEKNHLKGIAERKIDSLNPRMIQSEINKEAALYSPKTVRNVYGFLTAVMQMYAPDVRLSATMPQKIKREICIPTEEEVKEMIKKAEGTEMYTPIVLAAMAGMRRSEICALQKCDLVKGTLTINKAKVPDEDGVFVVKTTKTFAGTRKVELPPELVDKIAIPVTMSPDNITKRFFHLCGGKFHFHALRHYHASVLHAMGIPDLYIMERCGWGDASTLKRIYQHVMTDKQKSVNEQINSKIFEIMG